MTAIALVTRLFELTTRLFNERVDQARGELQLAGRRAVLLFAGGLLCAIGIAFLAAAVVEVLALLIHNRALRLVIVAVPLVAIGSWIVARAAANDRDHDRHQGQDQDHVRPGPEAIAGHQPNQ